MSEIGSVVIVLTKSDEVDVCLVRYDAVHKRKLFQSYYGGAYTLSEDDIVGTMPISEFRTLIRNKGRKEEDSGWVSSAKLQLGESAHAGKSSK